MEFEIFALREKLTKIRPNDPAAAVRWKQQDQTILVLQSLEYNEEYLKTSMHQALMI
ncbi:187_t:CDS:2 [Diversispora eburnea]|uniref:187_t:CDS:1 n=1 Tax=Diversispora eburnea TaxID=1213867 RepID=A0A9N9C1F5_9GLOM|nr:187_t:CDS:2 [Diversispora eburnea]